MANLFNTMLLPNLYTPWQNMLVNAWSISRTDAFVNTPGNPFAAIYDPSIAPLGSTPSLSDTGRGINTATEVTNPPINTATALGTDRGLLYNGTTTTLNAGSDISIDNIFAAGGCYIAVIKPLSIGEVAARIFYKTETSFRLGDAGALDCRLYWGKSFTGTNGDWRTTNNDIVFNTPSIIALIYDSSNVANVPTIYVNSLTPKAVTINVAPIGMARLDGAFNLILGNTDGTRTFDGYLGKQIFLKSIPTSPQLSSVFNFLATEYSITLT